MVTTPQAEMGMAVWSRWFARATGADAYDLKVALRTIYYCEDERRTLEAFQTLREHGVLSARSYGILRWELKHGGREGFILALKREAERFRPSEWEAS